MTKQSGGNAGRRGFLTGLAAAGGWAAMAPGAQGAAAGAAAGGGSVLPEYTKMIAGRAGKQSSWDRTGGNADYWPMAAGETREVFRAEGAGVITHVWFTIAAESGMHLKEMVLRAWWDGSEHPSIEAPMGDFFGLNLGSYVHFESAYLACSPGKSLNCYFAMPYAKGARMTVTNEGRRRVGALYSNIDYRSLEALPEGTLYFHSQYRQSAPCVPVKSGGKNLDGKDNYVFAETHGRGHLMGVTLGVLQNADGWWGEGDEMIFIDDEEKPAINGTGSEDYFLGSWDFGGVDTATPFGFMQYGAPMIQNGERTGGRYCCYRWHGDNPVSFERYMKHTIEHGHANDRGDNFFSACYWYQDKPAGAFPAMPPVAARVPKVKTA